LLSWPTLLSRSPSVRRTVIKFWRILLRVQRATLARAVLVINGDGGRVLVHALPSQRLELPRRELSSWVPIETQVDAWLAQLRCEKSSPTFVSVEGTSSVEGVTFLYTATLGTDHSTKPGELWLDYDTAKVALGAADRRLLDLCASRTAQS